MAYIDSRKHIIAKHLEPRISRFFLCKTGGFSENSPVQESIGQLSDFEPGKLEVIDVYSNDKFAVDAWLSSKPNASPHSIRSYRQAVKHFWEWLSERRGTQAANTLLSARTLEADAYLNEIQKRPVGRAQKPLNASTVKHRITILHGMYAYWMKPRDGGASIVKFNPFDEISRKVENTQDNNLGATRSLSIEEQKVVEDTLESLPKNTKKQYLHYLRARLIWALGTRMGLRRAEISALRSNDFRLASSGAYWKIEILGKGRRANQAPDVVVAPDTVMDEVKIYRTACGQHPTPLPSDDSHLIRHINAGNRRNQVCDAHIGKIMKQIFLLAADRAEKELRAPHMATRLRQASAHWGRHTWFMNALKEHDLKVVSRAGRHRDIRTTMKSYVGTSEEDLAKVMASGKPLQPPTPAA